MRRLWNLIKDKLLGHDWRRFPVDDIDEWNEPDPFHMCALCGEHDRH